MADSKITAKECFRRRKALVGTVTVNFSDACDGLPAKYEYEGKPVCILHFPHSAKNEEFDKAVIEKLGKGDYNFHGCHFPSGFEFSQPEFNESLNFMEATFNGEVVFSGKFIGELDFRHSTFEKESKLIFRYCDLRGGLDLRNAHIRGQVRFEGGESMSTVDGNFIDVLHLVFDGDKSWLDLQNVIIEQPEHVVFHTVRLQPNWFVEVDCRKFVFTDCRWLGHDGKTVNTIDEVDSVYMKNGVLFPVNPHALLTKTCLQLAENYDSNKDYETSSLFWKMANDSKRYSEYWGYKIWSLNWWYWLLSFYGESWKRAAFWFLLLIILFAIGYKSHFSHFVSLSRTETQQSVSLDYRDSLIYSLRTGTLQKPDPQPTSKFAKTLVATESILVPLQAALLALAIRRRFMR